MIFQIENTTEGYIVSVCHNCERNWRRLRNFGDRQGDARAFMMYDCPKLEDAHIKILERNFDVEKKYIRVSSRKFITQQ